MIPEIQFSKHYPRSPLLKNITEYVSNRGGVKIVVGSLANTGAMSVSRMMGARLLLSVSLTQLAMTTPLVMAQSLAQSPTDSLSLSPAKEFFSFWKIIVGVSLAFVFVKILVILAVFWYCLIKKRERTDHANCEEARQSTPEQTSPQTNVEDFNAQQSAVLQRDIDIRVRKYSYAEVKAISNNWIETLGEGGFGTVYHGEIFSHTSPTQRVALKRLSARSQQGTDEFLNEVNLLSRIHHRNLVPLVGYCDETNNQVLIYEYMQKGSLADWLYGEPPAGHRADFSWYNRLLVALHAAQGLEYLHDYASPYIIHRDVKSSNILITSGSRGEWEGRVADFGLSKTNGISDQQRTHMTTRVMGTLGYLDPEYLATSKLTTKTDVYSFGIVLLELVTGHRARDQGDGQFQLYVQSRYQDNQLETIADPNLKRNYDLRSMEKIAGLALRCAALQGIDRPTMRSVVTEIRNAMGQGQTSNNQHTRPATTNYTQDSLAEPDTGPLLNPQ